MILSSTTPDFWRAYHPLPDAIKVRARLAYKLWRRDPRHPSLQFKKVGTVWSVRIGSGYRALAILREDTYYWFWIGTHDDYENLIAANR